MPQWIGSVATVATALVALAALIMSIWASRRVARRRDFELLLERIDQEAAKREAETRAITERFEREAAKRDERFDREAAKREAGTREIIERFDQEAAKRDERFEREVAKREEAIRDVMDRSDRKFEALQRRSDELYRRWLEISARATHTEVVLETEAETEPAASQDEAVAAQDVLGGQPGE